jgi:hypothetical protein
MADPCTLQNGLMWRVVHSLAARLADTSKVALKNERSVAY